MNTSVILKPTLLVASFVALLVGTPLAFGGSCELLFGESLPKSLQKLKNNSPSGLLPENRIPRDGMEFGRNGLHTLNPAGLDWIPSNPASMLVETVKPSQQQPEGHLHIEGTFTQTNDPLSIKMIGTLSDVETHLISNAMTGVSGLKLRVSSSDPDQLHRLIFSYFGMDPVEVSFRAPTTPTDIILPLPSIAVKYRSDVRIVWHRQKLKKIDLHIYGPLTFERSAMAKNSRALEVVDDFLGDVVQYFGRVSLRRLKFLLAKAIDNTRNPQLLKYAVSASPEQIKSDLEAMGNIRYVEFRHKVTLREFFIGDLRSNSGPGMEGPAVPIEMGTFAKEHSSDAHARLLALMMKTMTKDQREDFLEHIYSNFFGGTFQRGWMSWDILFDAPGSSTPHSPLWWRNQRELLGLPIR